MSGSAQQLDQVRDAPTAPDQRRGDRPRGRLIYRHTALVRATHWINVVLLTILLMSGLQIFNAHPALYWGEAFERATVQILDKIQGHSVVGVRLYDC